MACAAWVALPERGNDELVTYAWATIVPGNTGMGGVSSVWRA